MNPEGKGPSLKSLIAIAAGIAFGCTLVMAGIHPTEDLQGLDMTYPSALEALAHADAAQDPRECDAAQGITTSCVFI